MAWSSDFVDRLNAGGTFDFVWALEVMVVGAAPSAGTTILASQEGIGNACCIGLRGVRVQGGRLSMQSWTSTVGAFTIDIVGDPSTMFEYITRGSWVRVLCGFPGWTIDDYQPVAIGRVYTIRGAPPLWTIECWDWKSALRSRNDPAHPALFWSLGSTTVAAAFAANSDTSLTTTSTTDARESVGTGALRVAGPTADFYLTFTGTATGPIRYTGVSTANKFATSQEAVSTEAVSNVAYLSGHPLDIVRKVLASTGTASANGAYDKYPSGWGYAIPDAHIDHDDVDRWQGEVVTVSGTYTVELHVDEAQEDGLSWLEGWMTPMGLFFAVRQGKITVRAVGGDLGEILFGDIAEITDADIEAGPSAPAIEWECWDSDYSIEYQAVRFTSTQHNGTGVTDTATAADPATLPAGEVEDISLAESAWDNTYAVEVVAEVRDRLAITHMRIPERLTLSLPLRFAQCTPGDGIYLSTTRVYGREESSSLAYESRLATITEVSPDWMAGRCTVSLAIFPTTENAFG